MSASLTILLTNIWLETRAGSEAVTRDLALGLLRRSHRPIVYSPALGMAAQDIIARGVPVIDDLRNLAEPPDLIHAHHSIPCGEALIRFPRVPALYCCHAFSFWIEAPVHFPQIAVYAAVDEACHDRLAHMHGINPRQIVMLPNAVDLSRVPARPAPLRQRPLRAAAFGKAGLAPEIYAACAQAGIEFATLGSPGGASILAPEHELGQFDLVFATGRAAIEAMCCGCAVIVCDARGMAGMVTVQDFDALRARNFGLRSLTGKVSVHGLLEEIARYDAGAAAAVAERARNEADLEKLLDRIEGLYDEILDGPRRPVITVEAHEQAVARFLHENLPRRPGDTRWPWLELRQDLENQIQSLQEKLVELSKESAAANQARLLDLAERKLGDLVQELTIIKRSRLLRLGRWLRRITGQPTPY